MSRNPGKSAAARARQALAATQAEISQLVQAVETSAKMWPASGPAPEQCQKLRAAIDQLGRDVEDLTRAL